MAGVVIKAEPGSLGIDMTREFNATPAQLLRAWTDPELLVQWLGPRGMVMKIQEYDVRHGGKWQYTHADEQGNEYGFQGVFHGEPSVEKGFTQTFEFDGAPGHICLESLTFEEIAPRRTIIHTHSVYQSLADRDAMLESGMEHGVNEGYERLEELLADGTLG